MKIQVLPVHVIQIPIGPLSAESRVIAFLFHEFVPNLYKPKGKTKYGWFSNSRSRTGKRPFSSEERRVY